MSEPARAVGPPNNRANVVELRQRLVSLEAEMHTGLQERLVMAKALAELTELIGKPGIKADGSDATGLYDLFHSLSSRLGKFEKFWYEVRGAVKFAVPAMALFGAALWFLGGDKITKLFHG